MTAKGSLMRLSGAQLDRVCRRQLSPVSAYDPWQAQPWWRRLGPEPVDIAEYDGERVIAHSRHHWCVPLINMGKMSAEMLAVGVLSVLMAWLPFSTLWLQVMMVLCTVGHQCVMSRHLLRWRADLVIVTNWRLIRTGGILSSGVKSYRWETVNNFERKAAFLARLFSCWNLRIVQGGGLHNQGADDEYVTRVPRKIARLVEALANRPAVPAQERIVIVTDPGAMPAATQEHRFR